MEELNESKKGIWFGAFSAVIGLVYWINNEKNREGSDLWYKNAFLDELEKRREKIEIQFRNAGLNNLNDIEYSEIEREKNKLDNIICAIKMLYMRKKHPNQKIIHREHGRYLPNDD